MLYASKVLGEGHVWGDDVLLDLPALQLDFPALTVSCEPGTLAPFLLLLLFLPGRVALVPRALPLAPFARARGALTYRRTAGRSQARLGPRPSPF